MANWLHKRGQYYFILMTKTGQLLYREKRTKLQQNIVIFCKMLPAFKLEVIWMMWGMESLLNINLVFCSTVKCFRRSDLTVNESKVSFPHGNAYCTLRDD